MWKSYTGCAEDGEALETNPNMNSLKAHLSFLMVISETETTAFVWTQFWGFSVHPQKENK